MNGKKLGMIKGREMKGTDATTATGTAATPSEYQRETASPRRSTSRRTGRLRHCLLLAAGLLWLHGGNPLPSSAQEGATAPLEEPKDIPFSVGLLGGFSFNPYLGTMDIGANPTLGGGACGEVGMGTGSGAAFGLFAEYRLSSSLGLGVRGLYEDRSGAMTADAPASSYRNRDGEIKKVESLYRLEFDMPVPSLELYAAFSPFSFPLRFTAGPKLGFSAGSGFEFAEELPQDNELAFGNGSKRSIYAEGDLDPTLLIGLAGGVGYVLPMGGGFDLVPELSASIYLNSPVAGESAPMIAGLRPSVAFRYRFRSPRPDPPVLAAAEPVPPPAPPPPPAPQLSATVLARGISPEGETQDKVLVRVRERVRRREIALLPYIFFDENSSEIPARYLRASAAAEEESIVERYRDVLDLLGRRMAARPGDRIKLVGTNADLGKEKGNTALSKSRAESVRNYLTERWNIDPSRIEVAARNLPENPSNSSWPGGQAENRRVEIVADEGLLAPLVVEDTVRSYSSPGVRIDSDIKFDVPFTYWEIRFALGERLIRTLKGGGILKNRIDEELTPSELKSLAEGEPLSYGMRVQDEAGGEYTTPPAALDVEVVEVVEPDVMLNDTSVEVSTPVLFGYNSAELGRSDLEGLLRLRNMLPAGAGVTVTGFADSLGESGYNRALSQRRAEAVAKIFDNFPVTVVAAGERSDMVRDDTPESRFYIRTVTVEVVRE